MCRPGWPCYPGAEGCPSSPPSPRPGLPPGAGAPCFSKPNKSCQSLAQAGPGCPSRITTRTGGRALGLRFRVPIAFALLPGKPQNCPQLILQVRGWLSVAPLKLGQASRGDAYLTGHLVKVKPSPDAGEPEFQPDWYSLHCHTPAMMVNFPLDTGSACGGSCWSSLVSSTPLTLGSACEGRKSASPPHSCGPNSS